MRETCVSVVIPVFRPNFVFLKAAIGSVEAQTYPYCELVVVVDQDDDPAIVDFLTANTFPRMSVIVQPNGGQSSARNTGWDAVSSKYLALLDQDDLWLENHLENAMAHFARLPKSDLVYSGVNFGSEDGIIEEVVGAPLTFPYSDLMSLLAQNLMIWPSSMLINRLGVLKDLRFDNRYRGYEDDDFIIRSFQRGASIDSLPGANTVVIRNHEDRHSYSKSMLDSARMFYFNYSTLVAPGPGERLLALRFFPLLVKRFLEDSSRDNKNDLVTAMLSTARPELVLAALLFKILPKAALAEALKRLLSLRSLR
jgi:glycosyltransferase involved in cell wall biosynthesis